MVILPAIPADPHPAPSPLWPAPSHRPRPLGPVQVLISFFRSSPLVSCVPVAHRYCMFTSLRSDVILSNTSLSILHLLCMFFFFLHPSLFFSFSTYLPPPSPHPPPPTSFFLLFLDDLVWHCLCCLPLVTQRPCVAAFLTVLLCGYGSVLSLLSYTQVFRHVILQTCLDRLSLMHSVPIMLCVADLSHTVFTPCDVLYCCSYSIPRVHCLT